MRRARLVPAVAACAALGVLVLPGVAEAHDPIIVDDSQTTPEVGPLLPDGTISFALYGVVAGAGDTRGFRAVLAEGDRLVVTLLAPDLAPEQAMTPDELPVVRIDAPDGTSRDLQPDERVAFDEPFSGTRYLRLVEIDEPALAGEYAVTVVGRAPARFTVSIGTIEQFGTPVEGVVDRGAGVAGVQAWYDAPPPAPTATEPTAAAPTMAAPTTAAATTVSTTTVPTTSAAPTTVTTAVVPDATTSPPAEENDGPEPNGIVTVLIATVIAVVVIGAAFVLVRRRGDA